MRLLPVLLLAACAATSLGCTFREALPRAELQAKLAAQFPIEKTAGLWAVRLVDPVLSLDAPRDRVGLELGIVAAGLVPDAGGVAMRSLAGHAGVEGRIEYVAEKGAFYLREPSVRTLDFPDLPLQVEVPLRIAAEAAIRVALRDRPVYVLDRARSERDKTIQDHLSRIWVEKDVLVVEVHL